MVEILLDQNSHLLFLHRLHDSGYLWEICFSTMATWLFLDQNSPVKFCTFSVFTCMIQVTYEKSVRLPWPHGWDSVGPKQPCPASSAPSLSSWIAWFWLSLRDLLLNHGYMVEILLDQHSPVKFCTFSVFTCIIQVTFERSASQPWLHGWDSLGPKQPSQVLHLLCLYMYDSGYLWEIC